MLARSGEDAVVPGLRGGESSLASVAGRRTRRRNIRRRQIERMRHTSMQRMTRARGPLAFAAVVVAIGVALSASVAQGRVDPGPQQAMRTLLSETTDAKVTGGGTVSVQVGFGT